MAPRALLTRGRTLAGLLIATTCAAGCAAVALAVLASHVAAAAPVGGPRFAKRGVASGQYLNHAPGALARIGATWSYDWSATAPPSSRGPEWVPMVWGSGSVTPGSLAALRAAHRSRRARYLLGFNEPDSAGQANMTPARAAGLWPQLQRTGLTLGSPAPAVPTDGWLAQFMTLVHRRHLHVSFIALHYYQDFTDPHAVSELRQQLIALHDRYHLPLWITEIGALDLRPWHEPMHAAPTPAAATSYMRRLFAMLDNLPFIQRYAWFMDNCWNDPACRDSSLFNGRGQLTPAGRTFASAP